MKRNVFYIFFFIFLISCSNSEYDGYKRARNNIHYKLIAIGENSIKPKAGDYITVDLSYKTLKDSLFFSARRKFKISVPQYKGAIDECFSMLSEKDHASFIISADNFFNKTLQTPLPGFLTQGDMMIVEIKMIEIQTESEYNNEKEAFLKWVEDFDKYEQVILKQFINSNQLDLKPTNSGLFHLKIREGNGIGVIRGDTITVDYEGKFLNGKFFDSTKKRNSPFQFIFGTQWQVVKGLEEAIGMMEENEKSLFIIPSPLAFGESGSSTGIIPPFTSLIFEVELLSVKKSKK